MAQKAFVFVTLCGRAKERYIGVTTLDPNPALGVDVQFRHQGRSFTGRIVRIQPAHWNDESKTIPTIRIIQDGTLSPSKRTRFSLEN